LVDEIFVAALRLESLTRLKVKRDHFVSSEYLAPNRGDLTDTQNIFDFHVVIFFFLLAPGSSAFFLLFLLFLPLDEFFDFLLYAFVFLFAFGGRELFAVDGHQSLDELLADRRDLESPR